MPKKKKIKNNLQFQVPQIPLYSKDEGMIKIAYSSDELFGEQDAAYEKLDTLRNYSVIRKDCTVFFDENKHCVILCAPKGTGKTTMCRLWEDELSKRGDYLSLMAFDSEFAGQLIQDGSLTEWIMTWKKAIIGNILSKYKISPNPYNNLNILEAIEKYESRGDQSKDIIELLHNYVERNHNYFPELSESVINDVKGLKDKKIWVFIDEVDQYFSSTQQDIYKMAGLLIAAREMSGYIKDFHIRVTIKPNVWAILLNHVDSLAPLRPLVISLEWDAKEIRTMLAKRVQFFLQKNNIFVDPHFRWLYISEETQEKLLSLFFSDDFDLGKGNRSAHNFFSTLGLWRPRWVLDLCRLCAKSRKENNELITPETFELCAYEYGMDRINDIYSEYKYLCVDIKHIILRFYGKQTSFKFHELIRFIEFILFEFDRPISIIGIGENCNSRQILKLLYQLRFIEPQKKFKNGTYKFIYFKDQPDIIDSAIPNDSIEFELFWVINPAFRNALGHIKSPVKQS